MKNVNTYLAGVVAASALICSIPAQALVLTLQPDNGIDAQVDTGSPDFNLGTGSELIINWFGNERSIGLIQFDLSALPSGAIVTSASLSLFHTFNGNNGSQYDIFRVTSTWDEASVTFNTAPTINSTAVSSLTINDTNTFVSRDWDITALVSGWADGSFANFGMWIEEIPVQGNASAYFAASDQTVDPARDPKLTINYRLVNGVPEPASLALLGIGLVGLGAMRRKQHTV